MYIFFGYITLLTIIHDSFKWVHIYLFYVRYFCHTRIIGYSGVSSVGTYFQLQIILYSIKFYHTMPAQGKKLFKQNISRSYLCGHSSLPVCVSCLTCTVFTLLFSGLCAITNMQKGSSYTHLPAFLQDLRSKVHIIHPEVLRVYVMYVQCLAHAAHNPHEERNLFSHV